MNTQSFIQGGEISNYRLTAISLGEAKKENRQGVKAKYATFSYKNCKRGIGDPIRDIKFEDQLGKELLDAFATFLMIGEDGTTKVKDSRGLYVVDTRAIIKDLMSGNPSDAAILIAEEYEFKKTQFGAELVVPGATTEKYKLRKGTCYANDVDGKHLKNRWNEDVTTDTITVFVQVDYYTVDESGCMVPHYVNRKDPDTVGSRLEDAFYHEPVSKAPAMPQGTPATDAAAEAAESSSDPF